MHHVKYTKKRIKISNCIRTWRNHMTTTLPDYYVTPQQIAPVWQHLK